MTTRMENAKLFRVIAIGVSLIAATAHGAQASEIVIDGGWFRALPPAVPSGAYFTLRNGGTQTVTLVGADSPACGMLMLHKSENHGGMGSMTDMETVDIAAGGVVLFTPGGYHLMCMDAKPVLKPGASVPVTLSFKGGKMVTANFLVRNAAGH